MSSEVKPGKKTSTIVAMLKSPPPKVGPTQSVGSDSRHKKSVSGAANKSVIGGGSSIISKKPSGPTTYVTDSRTPNVRKDLRIFNELGEDVTPRPLLPVDVATKKASPMNVPAENSSGGTPSDFMSQGSIFQPGGPANASTFGGPNLFIRSVFSASESGRSSDSISEEFGDPGADFSVYNDNWNVEIKHEELVETLNEDELSKIVELKLAETDTMWLLDMPSVCATSEGDEALAIVERNNRYQELTMNKQRFKKDASGPATDLTKNRAGNDRYVERSMNTFNDLMKNKMTQTTKITHRDASSYATIWDMYDTYSEKQVIRSEDDDEIVLGSEKKSDEVEQEVPTTQRLPANAPQPVEVDNPVQPTDNAATMSSVGVSSTIIGVKKKRIKPTGEMNNNNEAEILQSDSLKRHLVIVERAINLNTYQQKQASYRNFQLLPGEDQDANIEPEKPSKSGNHVKVDAVPADLGPSLEKLWSYQCPLTRGRNVSCIAWNPVNPDLVAVGYGQFDYMKQKGGLVCCWSVKNPEFPERVYPTSAGVLSVAFSRAHPNLLAVGLYDGTVAIFNVCTGGNEPVLDSCEASGKHTGPVWQLKWIEKEHGSTEEYVEVLVTISTDGRATQWAIRKGFESYDLMKLKRVFERSAQSSKSKKSDAMISKFAGGLCFDFSAKDSNIYLVGTEDGNIHKCSCSYNEQYLDSYFGHTGPVYAVSWSPFDANIFISCSADWSVRLWHQDRSHPVLNLFSSTRAVVNVCWSPNSSTAFTCVNEGALEVWDLSQSTLDPVLVNVPSTSDTKMSAVKFAINTNCLLVGDSDGQVSVLQLHGMPTPVDNQIETLQQVMTSSLASQLKN